VGALPRSDDLHRLPAALPVPVDDGGCAHLPGRPVPAVSLLSTQGRLVDLAALKGTSVVYAYPRTGRPDVDPPTGWNQIRLHLPFELLSDAALTFAGRLRLPTFAIEGMTLIKRLTLIVRDGVIVHVFYPVFPPDRNPDDVAAWLRATRKEASHP
jgi:peroxiredoxin